MWSIYIYDKCTSKKIAYVQTLLCRYPRFLVSVLRELTAASLPSLKKTSSLTNSGSMTVAEDGPNYPSPLKSHTPTFRKLSKARSSHQIQVTAPNQLPTASRHTRAASTPHLDSMACERGMSRNGSSMGRLVWSRDSTGERADSLTEQLSIERSSRLAMYNKYPLVPCGRTSVQVSPVDTLHVSPHISWV